MGIPTSAPLLIKALKETPRDRKKVKNIVHNGKITLDQVVDIPSKSVLDLSPLTSRVPSLRSSEPPSRLDAPSRASLPRTSKSPSRKEKSRLMNENDDKMHHS